MNLILILLCALLNCVTGQTNVTRVTEIFPARILTQQKTISKNSDLYLTCSTFGKKNIVVYVYLRKGNKAYKRREQKADQNDSTFIIHRVNMSDSGNYSCVYSSSSDLLNKTTKRGTNMIQIVVIANFLPADISVAGPSSVSDGHNIEFRCTFSASLQTLEDCQLIQSYLCKNGSILQVQAFSVTKRETTFTIKDVAVRDSGNYSCVVLPSKCIQEHEEKTYGNNQVILEVTGSLMVQVQVLRLFTGVMISLFLCLGVYLWWKSSHGSALSFCSLSAKRQQADSGMLDERREQAEFNGLETQDDSSFEEEDEPYHNDAVIREAESLFPEDQGLYSVAAEIGSPDCLYATSKKTRTKWTNNHFHNTDFDESMSHFMDDGYALPQEVINI